MRLPFRVSSTTRRGCVLHEKANQLTYCAEQRQWTVPRRGCIADCLRVHGDGSADRHDWALRPEFPLMRLTSTQRGYGYRWQVARAQFLKTNPLCVMCKAQGIYTAATVIDHIKPHKGNQDLMWDRLNWQSLCKAHHDSDKQRIDHGNAPRKRIGRDGWPVD